MEEEKLSIDEWRAREELFKRLDQIHGDDWEVGDER